MFANKKGGLTVVKSVSESELSDPAFVFTHYETKT